MEICAANTTDLAEADMLCNGHYHMQGRNYVNIGAALETIGCGGGLNFAKFFDKFKIGD